MPWEPRARAVVARLNRRLGAATPGRPTRTADQDADRGTSNFAAVPGDRLLERPVFILCSIRSGSTLLRVMLNTHSRVHAPHELHLGGLSVALGGRFVTDAMAEISLDAVQLRYLLWDRVLHRELTRHGKNVLVNKTPSDAFRWRSILECWPDARFIYLLRHPAAVAASWRDARPRAGDDRVVSVVLPYLAAVEEARSEQPGLTVRYEDITDDPGREMRRICEFIGVEYEPAMVAYGTADHGSYKRGLGDWSARIRSGSVQPARKLPPDSQVPAGLVDIARQWGYLQ